MCNVKTRSSLPSATLHGARKVFLGGTPGRNPQDLTLARRALSRASQWLTSSLWQRRSARQTPKRHDTLLGAFCSPPKTECHITVSSSTLSSLLVRARFTWEPQQSDSFAVLNNLVTSLLLEGTPPTSIPQSAARCRGTRQSPLRASP